MVGQLGDDQPRLSGRIGNKNSIEIDNRFRWFRLGFRCRPPARYPEWPGERVHEWFVQTRIEIERISGEEIWSFFKIFGDLVIKAHQFFYGIFKIGDSPVVGFDTRNDSPRRNHLIPEQVHKFGPVGFIGIQDGETIHSEGLDAIGYQCFHLHLRSKEIPENKVPDLCNFLLLGHGDDGDAGLLGGKGCSFCRDDGTDHTGDMVFINQLSDRFGRFFGIAPRVFENDSVVGEVFPICDPGKSQFHPFERAVSVFCKSAA